MTRSAWQKAALLVLLLSLAVGLTVVLGTPEVHLLKTRADEAGVWGPVVFFAGYVGLSLVPSPKALLTVAGGVLFGFWAGAALALVAALVGAVISFALGRVLGREAVDRLTRGRLARIDELLSTHGLASVLVVRLIPVLPYTAINYSAGLTGVRLRHYVVGSALGMVPGSLAYAAVGAYGTEPWGIAASGTALVLLVVGGAWWARRLGLRDTGRPGRPAEPVEPVEPVEPG